MSNSYFTLTQLMSVSLNLVKQTEMKAAISDGYSDFLILECHILHTNVIIVY